MNKDIINVSAEDDIADIIEKIRSAKNKIVAIVPSESSGVLRSAVNIKLILKTADEVKKVPVIVSAEPAFVSLAEQLGFHISDSLQSKPYIPSSSQVESSEENSEESSAAVTEDFVKPAEEIPNSILDDVSEDVESSSEDVVKNTTESSDETPTDEEKDTKSSKKEKKSSKFSEKFPWIADHKKTLIISFSSLVVISAFLVWALVFAPSVDIKVSIKTSQSNFSETATFVTNQAAEDSSAGKFFLQEEKISDEQKIEFKATGSKDIGNKSTGKLTISTYFDSKNESGSLSIPANTQFVYGKLSYLSNEELTITWDGEAENCENTNKLNELTKVGCLKSGSVTVVAAEPGNKYDVKAGLSDWSAPNAKGISSIYNPEEIAGGTTNVVTVIKQSDVDEARKKLTDTISESEGRKKLLAKIPSTMLVLEDTFKAEISDSKSNVEVDAQIPEGTTPTITQSSVFTVYVVDKVRIEEYITAKATLANDQKIHSVGTPFVEYFTKSGEDYTGKLKTTYKVGPKVTEQDIREKSSGKKIGEVQSLIKSINGVSSVDIKKSYFWVNSIPADPNKLTINITVEE